MPIRSCPAPPWPAFWMAVSDWLIVLRGLFSRAIRRQGRKP